MPNWGAMMKYARYLPMVMEAVRGFRKPEESSHKVEETRVMLDDFKKDTQERLNALEEEQARLKTRVREVQSTLDFYRVFVWLFGAFSAIIAILAIVLVITRG